MSRNVSIMFLLQNSNERHDIPQRRLQVSKKLSVRGIKLYHENTLSVQDSVWIRHRVSPVKSYAREGMWQRELGNMEIKILI